MCGIFALQRGDLTDDEIKEVAARALMSLQHRGPDRSAVSVLNGIALGMCHLCTRASLNDPLPFQIGEVRAAYNGQIYASLGSDQKSASVLGGPEEVQALLGGGWLDGMWAAAAVVGDDAERIEPFRDPLGIKPLWMRRFDDGIAYASEVRPLVEMDVAPPLRPEAISQFLAFGSVVDGGSYWADICPVEPNWGGRPRNEGGPSQVLGPQNRRFSDVEIREAVAASVRMTCETDRRLGLAVSGGMDSSILAYEMHRSGTRGIPLISVLTDGTDDGIQSLEDARLAPLEGLGVLYTSRVRAADYLELLRRSVEIMGRPVGITSAPLYLALSDLANKADVDVLMVGEGADELWGGYRSYLAIESVTSVAEWYFPPSKRAMVASLIGEEASNDSIEALVGVVGDGVGLEAIRKAEISMSLGPLLDRTDQLTMANSIEARTPFLHGPASLTANKIGWDAQVVGEQTKVQLRKAYQRSLPWGEKEMKIPFRAPWDRWLTTDLARSVGELLDENRDHLERAGLDYQKVRCIYLMGVQGETQAATLTFRIVSLVFWLKTLDNYGALNG